MSYYSTAALDKKASDLLAEVRGLKFAVVYQQITYEEARKKSEVLLQRANEVGKEIAKKYGRKYRRIRFSDL